MARAQLPGLPARVWVYIGGIAIAALSLEVWWQDAWDAPMPALPALPVLVLLFFTLAVLAQHFPLTLGPKFKTNGSIAVYFAALLTCGPPLAMVVACSAQVVGGLTLSLLRREKESGKRTRGLASVWFNAGQISLAVGLAGVVYDALMPQEAPVRFTAVGNLIALPLAGATQYLVNSGSVALMVAIQQRRNPLTVWLSGRLAAARTAAGLLLLGVGMAAMARLYPWSPLLLAPLVAVLQCSLRWALDRREEWRTMRALAQQRLREAQTAPCTVRTGDAELMQALLARNPQALAALYDRFSTDAYRLALGVLGDRTAAEETVEAVFLQVWQADPRRIEIPETPRRWLLTLIYREATARRPEAAMPARAISAPIPAPR